MSSASSNKPKPAAGQPQPPPPTKKNKLPLKNKFQTIQRVPWNPWLALLFAALAFYLAQIVAAIIISAYPRSQQWSHSQATDWLNNSIGAQFIFVLLAEGLMVYLLYLFVRRYRCSFKIIGLKRPHWSDLGNGLLAVPVYYLFYLLTVGLLSHLDHGLNVDQRQQLGFDHVTGAAQLAMAFISLVVLPPLAEEIMVRGFIYSSLKKALPTLGAVLGTSLLFAAAHLPEGGASGPLYIAALDTFVLSLVLIYLREKTGSLWSSITLHTVKNGVAFLLLFVIHTG